MNSARKAVFLDRDGVINRRPPEGLYITSPGQFELLPGALAAISRLSQHGFLVFVVTNQRCIARGIVPVEVVSQIHERLLEDVAGAGGQIQRIYVCPHDYSDACECRKPKPGMLLQAAKEYRLDLSTSWIVGDTTSDIMAGRQVGCHTVFVGQAAGVLTDHTASDLVEAVERILAES